MKVFRGVAAAALLLGLCGCRATAGASAGPTSASAPASEAVPITPLDGSRLLTSATGNAMAAGSVTTELKAVMMGQPVTGTISVDASRHCVGSLDLAKRGPIDFLSDGTRVWLKGGSRLWGAERAAVIGDRYITGPESNGLFGSVTVFCSLADRVLAGDFGLGEVTGRTGLRTGATTTVVLVDRDGSQADVTDTTTPYVTRLRSGRDMEPFDFTYRDYGKPVVLTPPPAEAAVDVATALPAPGEQNGG
ncbi:hypothetical protein ABZW03_18265 [Kitasatospora sp. NPDC004799]|uniref:hypothetical protein n=1 Tax=Kitasatospora sp. NPDC004799 TaxID=3154460 RepID=UPI0033B54A8C